MIASARSVAHDDLDARVWCVICPLALFAVIVAHIVRVLLVKLCVSSRCIIYRLTKNSVLNVMCKGKVEDI